MDEKQEAFYFWSSHGMAEPQNHLTNCYFCAVKTAELTSRTRSSTKYPNLPSAIQPVPQCDELPIPVFHGFYHSETESESMSSSEESDRCEEVVVSSHNDELQLFTQAEMNDLVHDLDFQSLQLSC